MKHAYLILAHHEFDLLQKLVESIDDIRNDIFIHYDKKLEHIPLIKAEKSRITILENRMDVAWADVSIVAAEYALFECALASGKYDYYHLLSGVDFPLKTQNEIHSFFSKHPNKQFIGYSQYDTSYEIDRKVNKYHLFPKSFRDNKSISGRIKKLLRSISIQLQYLINYKRNKSINFKKGTQWVSVTNDFLNFVISQKKEVFKIYSNTFCSDEIFLQTLCWNSEFKEQIYDEYDEGNGCMRMIGWKNGVLLDWTMSNYEDLINSKSIFARKFNSQNMDVVNKIYDKIK